MRIIAGQNKGRLIQFPKHIRPTQDKVRQSIFDCLRGLVDNARILDLFAGSGAFGLEALSRGGSEVVFIDRDRRCIQIIKKNLQKIDGEGHYQDRASVFCQDADRGILILRRKKVYFDLIFLDPPYHKEMAKKALKSIGLHDILAPHGLVVVEHHSKDILDPLPINLEVVKRLSFGDIRVVFFCKKAKEISL